MEAKLKIRTGGRNLDLFKRWFELDEEVEADIAQMPEWIRPIARFFSRGFGWGAAIIPVILLGFGLFLMSGNDIESGAEFESLSSCLAAIKEEFPEQELHLNESQRGVISGVLESSAETFRCETDEFENKVVLIRSPGDVAETPVENPEADASSENDSSWSIRKSKTTFIRPFDRTGLPETPESEQMRKERLKSQKKGDPFAPIPAATGRCIAGCADFPNGFYDMKE